MGDSGCSQAVLALGPLNCSGCPRGGRLLPAVGTSTAAEAAVAAPRGFYSKGGDCRPAVGASLRPCCVTKGVRSPRLSGAARKGPRSEHGGRGGGAVPGASAGPQSRRDAVRACGNGTEPRGAAAAPTRSRSALRGARTGAVGAVPRGGARPARTCATCGACSCGGAAPPSASRGGGAAPGRALGARPRPTPRSVAVAEPPGPSRRRRGPRRSGGRRGRAAPRGARNKAAATRPPQSGGGRPGSGTDNASARRAQAPPPRDAAAAQPMGGGGEAL